MYSYLSSFHLNEKGQFLERFSENDLKRANLSSLLAKVKMLNH